MAQVGILEAKHDIVIRYSVPDVGSFHISISAADSTYCLATKHIPSQIPDVSNLHLPSACEKNLLNRDRGLILVTGPTRSGRSTTLAAFTDWVNQHRPDDFNRLLVPQGPDPDDDPPAVVALRRPS